MNSSLILQLLTAFLLLQPLYAAADTTPKAFLITGCARSGTTFITKFFQRNGYDVRHEREGSFGIVSWTMAVDSSYTPWGPGADLYRFDHIFHQVRHPLKTIASASNEPRKSWLFIQKFIPQIRPEDSAIVKAAKYWYYWNLFAESKAEWTYRIEDIENQVDELELRLGIPLNPEVLEQMPTNINTRRYRKKISWEELKEALDEDLYHRIVEMAARYGYDSLPEKSSDLF